MRKTVRAVAVTGLAAVFAAATASVAVSPASAGTDSQQDWLCSTRDATPVYAYGNYTGYLFTLSGGRGFRGNYAIYEGDTLTGFNGHGAEHPDRDGYVRAEHIIC